jgi:hypothetical protein
MIFQPHKQNTGRWNRRSWSRFVLGTCILVFILLGIGEGNLCAAHPKVFKESQVKAVFLYNLIKFVTWPGTENMSRKDPFVIGVLGGDQFGSLLSRVVHGERTRGREIVVKQYDFPARIQWPEVDMLFITGGAGIKFDKFTGPAAENNVLTVGEETGFCSRGGMINLVTRGRRILIEVNIGQIRKGGFRVSAQVLKLARIVKSVSGEDQ